MIKISDIPFIDDTPIWEVDILNLPEDSFFDSIKYIDKGEGRWESTDETEEILNIFNQIDKKSIEERFSCCLNIVTKVLKDEPGFKLIPHYDNELIFGIVIINLIDNDSATIFYEKNNKVKKMAPLTKGRGILYLNSLNSKHGYANTSIKNRYVVMSILYKI
jgi:hypothetical protein